MHWLRPAPNHPLHPSFNVLDRAIEGGEEALARLLERYEARRHSLPVFM